MARLFREIMSACLALEQPSRWPIWGPRVPSPSRRPSSTSVRVPSACRWPPLMKVFREVEAGAVNYGVVPVENSTEGVVNHTLDSFMDSSMRICGEVVLRIHHHLLVSSNTRRDKVSRVYSHPQSFAQCRKWLDAHYPHAERVPYPPTPKRPNWSRPSGTARRLPAIWRPSSMGSRRLPRPSRIARITRRVF